MLVDAEKDNLVIEKQRSDVEEKKLKIEGEKNENLGAAPCNGRTATTSLCTCASSEL